MWTTLSKSKRVRHAWRNDDFHVTWSSIWWGFFWGGGVVFNNVWQRWCQTSWSLTRRGKREGMGSFFGNTAMYVLVGKKRKLLCWKIPHVWTRPIDDRVFLRWLITIQWFNTWGLFANNRWENCAFESISLITRRNRVALRTGSWDPILGEVRLREGTTYAHSTGKAAKKFPRKKPSLEISPYSVACLF